MSEKMTMLQRIEAVGNRLPHPGTMFTGLALTVVVVSVICEALGVSATVTQASKVGSEAPKTVVIVARSLLRRAEIQAFFRDFVHIYSTFPPLGITVVIMLAIGITDRVGFFSAVLRRFLLGAPKYLVTLALAYLGILASIASVAGVIFVPTIGAALYRSIGRHPWLGVVAGYAAAAGGFTANLFVAGTDAILSGITESAATGAGITAPTHPLINWYFMIVASFVLAIGITLVTEKIIAPQLVGEESDVNTADLVEHQLTDAERRGLRWSGVTAVVLVVLLLLATVPTDGILRNGTGDLLPSSPLLSGIVPLLFFFFFGIGVSYGVGAGVIGRPADIPEYMRDGLKGSLSFLVVALPAAVFVYVFHRSQLATIMAAKGAVLLTVYKFDGLVLALFFMTFVSMLNLFMPSGSAKWLLLAPVFVPMFAAIGLSPAATQVVFRAGDSATNVISPIKAYLPVLIGLLHTNRRNKDRPVGVGTLISLELPYSIVLFLSLAGLVVVFYLFDLPLGPGVSFFHP